MKVTTYIISNINGRKYVQLEDLQEAVKKIHELKSLLKEACKVISDENKHKGLLVSSHEFITKPEIKAILDKEEK